MRNLFNIIGLLLLLGFAACNSPRREARRMMARAEALADTLPDSTVLLIDSVSHMEVYFSERSRMEMALLHADALFRGVSIDDDDIKAVLDRRSPIPDLERAANYFAEKRDYAKAALAALYSGYVQQYHKDHGNAMQSYKDAEQYGTLDNDQYLVAKARYRMGEMLYDDYLPQESLSVLKLAANDFSTHYEEHAMTLNVMAVSYIVLSQFDSAKICLDQSRYYAELCQSKKMMFKNLNNYSVLYMVQGNYDRAIDCLRQMETGGDSVFMMMSFLHLGQVFDAAGDTDSASYYYERIEELLPLVNLKDETVLSAYRSMSRCAEKTGDFERALQYRKRYEGILSSIVDHTEESVVYGVQRKYDYDALQNMMHQKIIRRHRIIIAISLLAVIGFAALAIVQIRLAKTRKAEVEAKTRLFHFMQQNKELSEVNGIKEKEVADYAMRYSDALNKEALAMRKLEILMKNKGDVAYLKALEEAVFEKEDHWDAMMKVFDTLYPGVRENLPLQYPELTEMEQKIFLLSYFNVSREDEALLFNKSVHLVDKWRTAIKKKTREKS